MKRILIIAGVLLYCCPVFVSGQSYGYTHYDNNNGLAGSYVYCMTQDKDGFLWFGTETGLSRFDGTHFVNFSQQDGLPDNEILQLFTDSKGRVWIAPFKKKICYYFRGKIHNQENDSLLKKLHIGNNIIHIAEDAHGNILMHEMAKLHLIEANGQITSFDKIDTEVMGVVSAVSRSASGNFWVVERNTLYELAGKRFTAVKTFPFPYPHFTFITLSDKKMAWRSTDFDVESSSFTAKETFRFPFSPVHVNFAFFDTGIVAECTRNGVLVYNGNDKNHVQHLLPGVSTSSILKDAEGNIWFSTLGQGIYRLNSAYVMNQKIGTKKDSYTDKVLCFARYKNWVLVGSDLYSLYCLDAATGQYAKKTIALEPNWDPVVAMHVLSNGYIVYGTFNWLHTISPALKRVRKEGHMSVKAFYPYKNALLVASSNGVIRVDPFTLARTDTIWNDRATTVYASNDSIFIGTLAGLYCRLPNASVMYLGQNEPVLQNRIAAVVKDTTGTYWIATYGEGMVAWRSGRIITRINAQTGLTSNICRAVYLNGTELWVGTDKGLNKIDLARSGYPVLKYTTGDGLPSNIINAIYVDSNKVFVATPDGVTFFNEQKLNSQSRSDLLFTDIMVGGKNYYPADMPVTIPHAKNNLQFNFVGISFKSAGDIRYRYRMLGLDSVWRETRETFLSYPTLPSGDYELQIQAINKFDVYSKILTARFSIEKLVWEAAWFKVLAVLLFLTLIVLLAWLIIYRIRKREEEKTAINRRMGELEQLARKAQMNPHFIFNSLNSIQQYVMDADIAGANKFISGFSRLIRQTLDFSSKPEISLEEELDYLTNYLELERTRLEDMFSWQVHIEEGIIASEYYIPPMILQPFVENSIRHGIRFRKDRQGKIIIQIKKENQYLVCILEDNGIGRKAAQRYKSASHIEYQSKGMSLTAERIAMLNKDSKHKIIMAIEDLEDGDRHALGTRVSIRFPTN